MRCVYAKQIVHTHQCCAFALPCNLFAMSVALNFRKCFALAALFVCGQPGGDRVRQQCCPRIYDMREIPQNGNKKALLPECLICLAEKQGFEPWLRFSRTTPLAGEPLRPLGYFSVSAEISIFSLLIISQRRRVVNNFGSFGR